MWQWQRRWVVAEDSYVASTEPISEIDFGPRKSAHAFIRQESMPDMSKRMVPERDMSWTEEDEEMFPIILTNLIFCLIYIYYM